MIGHAYSGNFATGSTLDAYRKHLWLERIWSLRKFGHLNLFCSGGTSHKSAHSSHWLQCFWVVSTVPLCFQWGARLISWMCLVYVACVNLSFQGRGWKSKAQSLPCQMSKISDSEKSALETSSQSCSWSKTPRFPVGFVEHFARLLSFIQFFWSLKVVEELHCSCYKQVFFRCVFND